MNKDPNNCPFCQAELGINYATWGISPELFEYYRDIHWRYHLGIWEISLGFWGIPDAGTSSPIIDTTNPIDDITTC